VEDGNSRCDEAVDEAAMKEEQLVLQEQRMYQVWIQ